MADIKSRIEYGVIYGEFYLRNKKPLKLNAL